MEICQNRGSYIIYTSWLETEQLAIKRLAHSEPLKNDSEYEYALGLVLFNKSFM